MIEYSSAELLARAITFATDLNTGLMRLDGTPYIYHLIEAANIVKECGYDIDYQIAAILHDVTEHPEVSLDDLSLFGEDVIKAVSLLGKHEEDEEQYVNSIRKNKIATVVKSATMISKLFEFLYLGTPGEERAKEDLITARQYLKEAYKYYFCKLSNALDDTINLVEFGLYSKKTPDVRHLIYNVKSLVPLRYSFTRKMGESTYGDSKNHPDFDYDEFSFFRVEGDRNAYIAIKDYKWEKSGANDGWWLGNAGWSKPLFAFQLVHEWGSTVV